MWPGPPAVGGRLQPGGTPDGTRSVACRRGDTRLSPVGPRGRGLTDVSPVMGTAGTGVHPAFHDHVCGGGGEGEGAEGAGGGGGTVGPGGGGGGGPVPPPPQSAFPDWSLLLSVYS